MFIKSVSCFGVSIILLTGCQSSVEEIPKEKPVLVKEASVVEVPTDIQEISYKDMATLSPVKSLHYPLYKALGKSGVNQGELIKALKAAKTPIQQKSVAYLISFMPERDLLQLSAEFILENVTWAIKARESFSWAKAIPEAIFLNDVLPHAVINERRDNWRKDFYEKFSPLVKDCKTLEEAIVVVNKNLKDVVKVKYSTKRKKPDQSPYESMETGLASCTGLSILLTDAMRSVGIPSRLAGTPAWTTVAGNHNWNEVWFDGKWYFTEFYPDSKGFNHGWLLARAAKADSTNWKNKIYATSYAPTAYWFPLCWDFNLRFVHGVDLTAKYKQIYADQQKEKAEAEKDLRPVGIMLYDSQGGKRIAQEVVILKGQKELRKGKTAGPLDDMNNILEFKLKKGEAFTVVYKNSKGEDKSKTFTVNDSNMVQKIKLYLK